jgi:transcriptional regulator with XRE-family HTH domain
MGFDGKALGRRLREFRERLDLTQVQVAERAGLDSMYISQAERGVRTPTLPVLVRIAGALRVSLGELVNIGEVTKDDALLREVREVLGHCDRKTRQVGLKILRALAEL